MIRRSIWMIACVSLALSAAAQPLSIAFTPDSNLQVMQGQQLLLQFQAATKYPPAGIDSNYKRSGFIHPICTPSGAVLTAIQPADHYHHYGLWNPWTHTLFKGDTVDFWNLAKKEGTVRFVQYQQISVSDSVVSFTVMLEHIRFRQGEEEKVLEEAQTIRLYKSDNPSQYAFDFESRLRCVSDSPLRLLTYRYGGLGWRANEYWNTANSEVLTSEGKTRKNADASRARWILAQGQMPSGKKAGMLIMDHLDNYNYPEPVRVWPEDEGNNQLFLNISPTKDRDWLLVPGKTYTLRYYMVVYDGMLSAAKADSVLKNYLSDKP